MDILKKTRTVQRTAFTKAYNKLEELISLTEFAICDLETELNVFISKEERLEQTHSEILASLNETEFDGEYEAVEEFRDKALRIRHKAKKKIEDVLQKGVHTAYDESENHTVSVGSSSYRRFKLPKLELRKFDGEIKEWLQFWSQFEKIHKDQDIVDSDKFQYLLQATVEGSRAREVVESFPPTGENYQKAVDSLKSRFGRDDLLVEVYVRELLKLVLRNATSHDYSSNLSALYDSLESQIRALETLGVTTEKSAALLYPLVESCMPEDLLRAWQRSPSIDHGGDLKIRLDSLLTFLKTEVESEERITLALAGFGLKEELPPRGRSHKVTNEYIPTAASLVSTYNDDEKLCIFCNGKHDCLSCYKAQKMSLTDKQKVLKSKGLCFKCIKGHHRANQCKRFVKCAVCNKVHYVIMCPELPNNKPGNSHLVSKESGNGKRDARSVNLASFSSSPKVLLQTLKISLIGKDCALHVRALFDTGSQKSYIKKETAVILGLVPLHQQVLSHSLFGGTKTSEKTHNVYKIEVESLDCNFHCNFDVLDQENICDAVPSAQNGPWMQELEYFNICVNDSKEDSGPIDVLIGADVAGRLFTGQKKILPCGLVALETYLGWTLMGKTPPASSKEDTAMLAISMFVKEASISDLFSLDILGIKDPTETRSRQEKELLTKQYFEETVKINADGRYEVALPWREEHLPLPTNKDLALKRLESSNKRLLAENLYPAYEEVFREWASLGMVEEVPAEPVLHEHYLPHRPVIKHHGTTRVRPVFDASAKQVGCPSLNQCLESGPNLLELIPNLLLRFREHKYGIVADIEKAFLQISVRPEDRNFLRFFWLDSKNNLTVMRHTRVVFGVKSSPFLLEAVLDHHLQKYSCDSKYETTAGKLLKSFYVDNLVISLDSESEILPFIREARLVMAEGKFNLRGWQYTGDNDPDNLTPLLGLVWDRKEDELKVNFEWLENYNFEKISKRTILSVTHKIFDPIGFLCPVLLTPKLLLQKMWKENLSWDSEVKDEIRKDFLDWSTELNLLKKVCIKRCFSVDSGYNESVSIHTFCDASAHAYAAAVFVRIETSQDVTVHLLAAKSRVAPVKPISIPRLELLAATVGARLCTSVLEGLQWKNVQQHFWTDSTTVLAWIQHSDMWSVFVNNRVEEIRSLSDPALWKHVPGTNNPADLPSRGCTPKQLLASKWWEGPIWLRQTEVKLSTIEYVIDNDAISQEKRKTSSSCGKPSTICSLSKATLNECQQPGPETFYRHFSNYDKIVRMIAWILRFASNCHNTRSLRLTGELTYAEVKEAEKRLLKIVQNEYFTEENYKRLSALTPYRDDDGLLRLKTKITYRKDSLDFRNPIILPSDHAVVRRLIMTEHKKNSHAGFQMLLNILREHYWILHSRKTVRSVLSKCVICLRQAKRNLTTPPPSLPENRIKDASIFEVIGIDLAGPLYLKGGVKAWIGIYTCAVYRAVHFELLSSLSTETFLQSFRRFIARRGRPSIVYSDNGSNFVGASNHLKLVNWDEIARYSTTKKIQWLFNPPSGPWWGGFWERLIGVMKRILRKVLGKALLSYEELSTVLCDTESIVNSRPLTHISDADSNLMPLSPNSFLQEFRQNDVTDFDQADANLLNKRLTYRQKLINDIRKRFRSEYLGLLIQRNDPKKHKQQVKIGDVVLIGSDNTKCFMWPLGLVTELLPGRDGISRLVRLQTTKGQILRPLQRIFPLEVSSAFPESCKRDIQAEVHNKEASDLPKTELRDEKTRSGRAVKAPIKLNL